ncbi:MAG: hypothetical protein RBT57_09975 [Paludibacter sp.]|nr:hypothetical protein [Paludibacter sp.]
MAIHFRCFVLLILCVFALNVRSEVTYNSGLHFRSFEVDQDKRTGLNLTPEGKILTPGGFTLSFDIQLHRLSNNFGYVFRLIGNDSINIDLVADITSTDFLFSLVAGTKSLMKVRQQEIKNFSENKWMTITLVYDQKYDSISLLVNKLEKRARMSTSKLLNINLFFGLNAHSTFATTDVPPMTIRNIRLYGDNQELKRHWKLEKHLQDRLYDEVLRKKALAINPVWEIDKHVKWQRVTQIVLPYELPQIAFDSDKSRIFIAKANVVYSHDFIQMKTDSLFARQGEIYNCRSNQLIYDSKHNRLLSYSFDNHKLAVFDFRRLEWTNDNTQRITPQFWHHSKYYDPKDSTLLTFGGYGYHKYKSDVMRYSVGNEEWKQHDLSAVISPRYLGSLGYLGDNQLLYFGGYGSKTGNQDEFPHNYYDLYKINTKTLEVKKLWEMTPPSEHFTNSNSLVVNKEKNTFYNLAYSNTRYSTSIKLKEYSIDKPEFKLVGDTIPFKFKDIESYCDLFYSSATSELIAVTSVSKNNRSEVTIYSIAYPPLHPDDVAQEEEPESNWGWYFLSTIILLPIAYFVRRQKSKRDKFNKKVNAYLNFEYTSIKPELKPSSINMLGYFQVIDKDGNNITGNFTATTSQMLVLMILHTVKNGQGISTQELTEILWPDKDTDSSRNNRNVYMSKLRLLIKNVGGIELINQNNYWSVTIENDVFCDYKNVMLLIDQVKNRQNYNIELVNELVSIVSRGLLLPNLQEEWVDAFKGDYTNIVIETLSMLLQVDEIKKDPILVLHIADAILKHDCIEEDIVKLKVSTLYKLGRKSQAKQCFDKFLESYRNFMGIDFKDSFDHFREMN